MTRSIKSYSEKLKDPRWQKKRLEVFENAGWVCENCGDGTKTLNVHHKFYKNGREPWDYEEETLQSLCEDCHILTGDIDKKFKEETLLLSNEEKELVIGYLKAIQLRNNGGSCDIDSAEEAMGFSDFFRINFQEVLRVITSNTEMGVGPNICFDQISNLKSGGI